MPAYCGFFWLAALAGVLILAREEVVAALLGLMAELQGLQPMFLGKDEAVGDAIGCGPLDAVLLDFDHQQYSEDLLEVIRSSGAIPVLFSPFRTRRELREVATRYGIRWFTLPTDPDTFARMLET